MTRDGAYASPRNEKIRLDNVYGNTSLMNTPATDRIYRARSAYLQFKEHPGRIVRLLQRPTCLQTRGYVSEVRLFSRASVHGRAR